MPEQTQNELEQVVKNYQLIATNKEIREMRDSFTEKLNRIIDQTADTVKQSELKESLSCIDKDLKEYVDNQVKTINLKYGPMKRDLRWAVLAVTVSILGIVTDLVTRYLVH